VKIWVETYLVEPPPNVTISGRFGSSAMFVAYLPIIDRWMWLQPGGVEERIAEPEAIFVDERWAREHPAKKDRKIRREKANYIHRRREEQLLLI
jgi:hypothetical protein